MAFARINEPRQSSFLPFDPGVLQVSPLHDNIQRPQAVLDQIQMIAPPNGHRRRRAALILPDYCARIAVLDFDAFPTDASEQLALLRFRLKKSVPFDVDSAVISHAAQPRRKDSEKIEVLAAVMAAEVVGQYEAPFRSMGFHPGLVTTSALAALNLVEPALISMLVKLNGRILTVLVMDGSTIKLARSVEMDEGAAEDAESILHPTIAYIEDELKAKPQRIWLCGFGAETNDYVQRWEAEWGVATHALRARFGEPGPYNAGLLGYLESVVG